MEQSDLLKFRAQSGRGSENKHGVFVDNFDTLQVRI